MSVRELSKEQLTELKQSYLLEKQPDVSLGEIVRVDEIVTDEEVFEAYEHVEFVQDDFFCSQVTNDPTDLTLINKED